jgi:hypothetical protein
VNDSGAAALRLAAEDRGLAYGHWVQQDPSPTALEQIHKDVPRTCGPDDHTASVSLDALTHVLCAHAARNTEIGYTQGLNFITATLLSHAAQPSEEEAFWVLCAITELLLPEHYLPSLIGGIVAAGRTRSFADLPTKT